MTFTDQSQRSGLNRRPLGTPDDQSRGISRRHLTLGGPAPRVKRGRFGWFPLQTVPKPYLVTLLVLATCAGKARVA